MSPLYYVLRSREWYWTDVEMKAWREFKTIVSADIALTVPKSSERLVMFTDASKSASSQILFVDRDNELKIVAANSRLFDPQTSLKPTHFKELLSLTYGIKTFMPYLCNSEQSPIFFCDAKNLISLNRNKGTSILAVSLSDFLSHAAHLFNFEIYSVPGHINFLSDLFSRHLPHSRFIDPQENQISKDFITQLPKDDLKGKFDSKFLKKFLSSPVEPSIEDKGKKRKPQKQTLNDTYRAYKNSTPEYSFYMLTCLLKELSRSLSKQKLGFLGIHVETDFLNTLKNESVRDDLFKKNSQESNVKVFNKHIHNIVTNAMIEIMGNDMTRQEKTKVVNASIENFRKMIKLESSIRDDSPCTPEEYQKLKSFLNLKLLPSSVNTIRSENYVDFDTSDLSPRRMHQDDAGIDLPVQESVTLHPEESILINSKIRFKIPQDHCGILYLRSSSFDKFEINHGVIDCGYRGEIKYRIKNISESTQVLEKGTYICQLVLHRILTQPIKQNRINVNETIRGIKGFGAGSANVQNSANVYDIQVVHDDDDDEILIKKQQLLDLQNRITILENQILETNPPEIFPKKVNFTENHQRVDNQNPFDQKDNLIERDDNELENSKMYNPYEKINENRDADETDIMQIDSTNFDPTNHHEYLDLVDVQTEMEELRQKAIIEQSLPSPIKKVHELPIFDNSVLDNQFSSHPYNVEENRELQKKDLSQRFNPKALFKRSSSHPKLATVAKSKAQLEPPELPPRRFSELDYSDLNKNSKRNFSKIISPDKSFQVSESKKEKMDSQSESGSGPEDMNTSNINLLMITTDQIDKFLSTYLFNIETKPQNAVEQSTIKVANLNLHNAISNSISPEIFIDLQKNCEVLDQLYTLTKNNSLESFKIVKKLLFTKEDQLCIPNVVMPALIKKLHDQSMHDKKEHLLIMFNRYFWHPEAKKLINTFVDHCITCRLTAWKFRNLAQHDDRTVKAKRPCHVLSLDILPNLPSSMGFNHLLVMVDEYSFYTMAIPMRNKSSPEIVRTIENVFIFHGLYLVIRTDNESCLLKALGEIKSKYLVTILPIAPYQKSQNVAETAVNFLKNKIGKFIYDAEKPQNKTCWPSAMVEICAAINNSIPNYSNFKTKATRRELFFNVFNKPPFENLTSTKGTTQIVERSSQQKDNLRNQNEPSRKHEFSVGDLIFIKDNRPLAGQFRLKLIPTLYKICKVFEGSKNMEVENLENHSRKLVSWTDVKPVQLNEFFNPDSLKIDIPKFNTAIDDCEHQEEADRYDEEADEENTTVTRPKNWTGRLRPRK